MGSRKNEMEKEMKREAERYEEPVMDLLDLDGDVILTSNCGGVEGTPDENETGMMTDF